MSGFMTEGSASANLLKFEGAPVASPLGFLLWDRANFNSDPGYHSLLRGTKTAGFPMRGISSEWWCRVAAMVSDLSDPTPDEVKLLILSALRTLSLSGQQHVLVHYWAATKSGNAYLLTTTDQPFGLYGNDEGLELYREGCLRHKLYIHPDENVAFGLPGYAFKNGTFLLTQNLHGWDGDQHPPCEAAIFDQIRGAFAVPVIFANKRFGVLEFVMNTPKDSYYNDIYEVYKALEFAGFQFSIYIDPPRRTFTPPTRDRITDSSMYDNYDSLVPDMGLSKSEAMKRVTSRYNLSMPAKGTFSSAHKTAGIPEWPWVRNTTTRAYSPPETIINPIPFEIAAAVEPQDAHLVDVTGEWEMVNFDLLLQDHEPIDAHPVDGIPEWELVDSDLPLQDLEPIDAHPVAGIPELEHIDLDLVFQDLDISTNQLDDYNEIAYQHTEDVSRQPLVGTHINQTTHVTREDAGFSEWSRMDMLDVCDSAYQDGKLMEVDTVFSL
ncbi:RWP-RK domain-containing protein [Artemisia annua]|uniref:RWP-RK domain-containing protein n=1 Tax=Artemisia annua TaxID=35608 RepID=A0A2U1LUE0_ARTAN|nr:RWP-RK domain-containing protein [Artemisia annua]